MFKNGETGATRISDLVETKHSRNRRGDPQIQDSSFWVQSWSYSIYSPNIYLAPLCQVLLKDLGMQSSWGTYLLRGETDGVKKTNFF